MYCFARFCNICVFEDQNLLHFDTRADGDTNLSCFDMLKVVSPELVSLDKNLPRLICPDCHAQLVQSYTFKQKCVKSCKKLEKFCVLLKLKTDYVYKENLNIFRKNRKRKMSLGYNKNTSKDAFYEMKRQKFGDTLSNVTNISDRSLSSVTIFSGSDSSTINLKSPKQIEKEIYEQFEKFCATLEQNNADNDSQSPLSESSKISSPNYLLEENDSTPPQNEDYSLEILNLHSEEQFQKLIAANSFEFSLDEFPPVAKKIELSAEEKFQKFIEENEFEVSLSQVSDELKENIESINIEQTKMVDDLTSDAQNVVNSSPNISTTSDIDEYDCKSENVVWIPNIIGNSSIDTSSSQTTTSNNLPTKYKPPENSGTQLITSETSQLKGNTYQNVAKKEIIEFSPLTTSSSQPSAYKSPLTSGTQPITLETPQAREKCCENIATSEIIEISPIITSSSQPSAYKSLLTSGTQPITLETPQGREKCCQNVEISPLNTSSSQSSASKNVPTKYKLSLISGSEPITLETPQGREKSCQNVAKTPETIVISPLKTSSSQPSVSKNVPTKSKLSLASGSQPITLETPQRKEKIGQNIVRTSETIEISTFRTSSSQPSVLKNVPTKSKLSLVSGSQPITLETPQGKGKIGQNIVRTSETIEISPSRTSSSQPSVAKNVPAKSKLSLASGSQPITLETPQGKDKIGQNIIRTSETIEISTFRTSSSQSSVLKNVPTKSKLSLASGSQPITLETPQGKDKIGQNIVRTSETIEISPSRTSSSQPSLAKNVPAKSKLSLASGSQPITLETPQGKDKNGQNIVRTCETIEISTFRTSSSQPSLAKNVPANSKLSLASGSQPITLVTPRRKEKSGQNISRTSEIIEISPLRTSSSQPFVSKNVPTKFKLSLASGSQAITLETPQRKENIARTEIIQISLNTSSSQQRTSPTSGAPPSVPHSKGNRSQNVTSSVHQSNSRIYPRSCPPLASSGFQSRKLPSNGIHQIYPERSTSGSQPYKPQATSTNHSMRFKPSLASGSQPATSSLYPAPYNVCSVSGAEHVCHDCKIIFKSPHGLELHMYYAHQIEKYKCQYCPQVYRSRMALTEHLSVHNAPLNGRCRLPKHICRNCGREFDQLTEFRIHIYSCNKRSRPRLY